MASLVGQLHEFGFERSVEARPEFGDSAGHYAALAHAGLARLAVENDRLGEAVGEAIAALELRPASAESPDGLGQTPLDTLRRLVLSLERDDRSELVAELEQGVRRVSPELWDEAH